MEDVAKRLQSLVDRLEDSYKGKQILLVAHGDTLSILWALVMLRPLENHREVALETGELRRLVTLSNPSTAS